MLDYRLETFIYVAKYLNFTKAAEALNITQPAVSQHIKYIEESYGIKLFHYHKKRLQITEGGSVLLTAITTMKHDNIYLREKLIAMQTHQDEIVFGCTLTVGEYIIPPNIARFLKNNKQMKIKMVVANTQELVKQINAGEIDFALVEGYFNKTEFASMLYSKENYIAVCGNDYHFSKPIHHFEDLVEETILSREKGSGSRDILERYAEEKNLSIEDFNNIIEIGNINTIKYMVKENIGIAFMYEAAVKRELDEKQLQRIELEDFHFDHDINFIYRKNSIFHEYYKDLFNQLKK